MKIRLVMSLALVTVLSLASLRAGPKGITGGTCESYVTSCRGENLHFLKIEEKEVDDAVRTWVMAETGESPLETTCGGVWVLGRQKHPIMDGLAKIKEAGFSRMEFETCDTGWRLRGLK